MSRQGDGRISYRRGEGRSWRRALREIGVAFAAAVPAGARVRTRLRVSAGDAGTGHPGGRGTASPGATPETPGGTGRTKEARRPTGHPAAFAR